MLLRIYLGLIFLAYTPPSHADSEHEARQALETIQKMNQAVQGQPDDCDCELTTFRNTGSLQPLSGSFNKRCDAFIGSNGYYGSWGALIGETLVYARQENPAYEVFFADSTADIDGVPGLCPRWRELSEEQRLNFWVWTMAAIAQAESSCNPSAEARGVNDIATGLTQLEKTAPFRYYRSSMASGIGYCDVRNVTPAEHNLRCALDIMLGHLRGVYGEPPSIVRNSYWEGLRSQGRNIAKMIKEFEACH